jgi:phosphatidylglycerophosphate synthase
MVKQSLDVYPTKWGKLTTTFQMLSVLFILMQCKWASFAWWGAVIFTVISGFDYVKRGFRILYALDNRRVIS